jgi:predicted RNase H-like HicB family nuclease
MELRPDQTIAAIVVFLYSVRLHIYGWDMPKRYTVSNGKLVLTLEEAPEGGYVVTAPLEPELITEAETISEAFENAADALKALRQSRVKLLRKLTPASATR